MTNADRAPRYMRTETGVAADCSGKMLLLHTGTWQYFEFDAVGERILTLLETPLTFEQLVTDLIAQFDVDAERCAQETRLFLDGMIAEGLVAAEPGA
ncbi:PqqD family protein [Sphingomonas sp.]|uniref:PqqD family protein n=1 Tax=Sphingomonas sp. TaxID=28214 RepID=UPI00307FC2FD